ncbi:MAG TPA: glycosyltransferase [Thermoanaerobaculia bacterium]|nr:glycosyltransferase [Thermoanaerobaculia bacterium]
MKVTFYLPGEQELGSLAEIDPDQDPAPFALGERAWILQTYLRLRAAGQPVELAGSPPAEGLLIFHAKHGREIVRHWALLGNAVLVGVRGDLREPTTADFQVLQNRVYEDGRSRFFVPSWPQPGLRRRDPARGARVERVAFKGFAANLHSDFSSSDWKEALRIRGIEWIFDAVEFRGHDTAVDALRWSDFHDIDLVLAVRPPDRRGYSGKPAAKLYNAWLAEVPALLGREPAYRELRSSELDYVEVDSAASALDAIDRLQSDPGLYAAMVRRGRERGLEFTPESITESWVELLWRTLPALAPQRPLQWLPHWLRPLVRRAHRALERRPAG